MRREWLGGNKAFGTSNPMCDFSIKFLKTGCKNILLYPKRKENHFILGLCNTTDKSS